jgi:hypothetical protein
MRAPGRGMGSRVVQRHPLKQVTVLGKAWLRESAGGRSLMAGTNISAVMPYNAIVIDEGDVWDSRTGTWYRVVSCDGVDLSDRDIYLLEDTFKVTKQLSEPIPVTFQGPVRTFGGIWVAREYNAKEGVKDKTARGAHMVLEFTPAYPADATEIVLVQTVRATKNAVPFYLNKTIEKRSYQGTSIDHVHDSRSFAYASVPHDFSQIEYTQTEDQGLKAHGGHGYRFQHLKTWRVAPAWLEDNPTMRGVTSESNVHSGQEFETTALATKGNDAGTYYGSVRWGWVAKDGCNPPKLIPLQVASYGSASVLFNKSVDVWNVTETSDEQSPFKLPSVPRLEVK